MLKNVKKLANMTQFKYLTNRWSFTIKRYLDMHKSKPWLTLAEVAKGLPLENLLTETDTPYFPRKEVFFSYQYLSHFFDFSPLHAVWSTRVSGIHFSTEIPLKFSKFSVLVTLSPTLMIQGHYISHSAISSAISLYHFLTLIKLYIWECENTTMKQNNPITEE